MKSDLILRAILSFCLPMAMGLIVCLALQATRILADYSIDKIKEYKDVGYKHHRADR